MTMKRILPDVPTVPADVRVALSRGKTKLTHQHEYVADTRPQWDGVYCRICGFRVPASMTHIRAVQDRLIK